MEIVNDPMKRQYALEKDMIRASAEKLKAEIAKAKSRDTEDEAPYSARLMVGMVEAVAEGVSAFMALSWPESQPARPSLSNSRTCWSLRYRPPWLSRVFWLARHSDFQEARASNSD